MQPLKRYTGSDGQPHIAISHRGFDYIGHEELISHYLEMADEHDIWFLCRHEDDGIYVMALAVAFRGDFIRVTLDYAAGNATPIFHAYPEFKPVGFPMNETIRRPRKPYHVSQEDRDLLTERDASYFMIRMALARQVVKYVNERDFDRLADVARQLYPAAKVVVNRDLPWHDETKVMVGSHSLKSLVAKELRDIEYDISGGSDQRDAA